MGEESFLERIIGSNRHGNDNEKLIVEDLNCKKISELKSHFKTFIFSICMDNNIKISNDDIIYSEFENNSKVKPDFYIIIHDRKFSVSCKLGSGNSVHQETLQQFTDFLSKDLKAPQYIIDNVRYYVWADGTLDGSGSVEKDLNGKIKSRFTAKEFKVLYPEKRKELLNFFKENQKPILERFIFQGASKIENDSNSSPLPQVDYVYHGNSDSGVWLSREEIINFHILNSSLNNNNPIAALPLGRMTLQAWNISKEGKTEHKRGVIQAKYGNMKNDFTNLMKSKALNLGTFYGDLEENDISSRMNKNKKSKDWIKLLNPNNTENYSTNHNDVSFVLEEQVDYKLSDNENMYVIKVKGKKYSKISQKKVPSKADAYVVEAIFDKNTLLMKQYSLSEDDLKGIDYKIICGTGISVKRDNSKSFTYQKLSINSFVKVFEEFYTNSLYLFIGNLFYTDKSKAHENYKMLENLEIDKVDFINYFSALFPENHITIDDYSNVIKNYCTSKVKEIIINNKKVSDIVFMGKGNFDEPYVAHYLYKSGHLVENSIDKFNITTGSGRSKGIYTLIIKP